MICDECAQAYTKITSHLKLSCLVFNESIGNYIEVSAVLNSRSPSGKVERLFNPMFLFSSCSYTD